MSYISLKRTLANHHLWLSEPFSRGQAWIDLLFQTNYKPSHIFVRGIRVDIQRGQLVWSQDAMAQRWRWGRKKVASFLIELEADNRITRQRHDRIDVITICNYAQYQSAIKQSGTTNDTTDDTTNHPHPNKGNKGNNTPIVPNGDFSALWITWKPYEMSKGTKSKAEEKYQAALRFVTHEILMAQAKAYCAQCAKTKTKTQHVATWLFQRGWETEYQPPPPIKTGFARAGL
jgi:hypothetical protein